MVTLRPLRVEDVDMLDERAARDAAGTARLGMGAARWWDLVRASPRRHGWVVVHEGRDAGYLDAEDDGGTVFVAALLFPDARGRGLGRDVIDAARELHVFRTAGAVVGCVEVDNVRARRLLMAAGFIEDGVDVDGLLIYRWMRSDTTTS